MDYADQQSSNSRDLTDNDTLIGSDNGHRATLDTDVTFTAAASSAVFNLTDRLQIFSYLVNSNRIAWYRVIMRIFLQNHRELYRYQLTAQEVRDAVRASFDPEYTLDQCQNDLRALKDWGNVTTIYDSSRATSIASFLSPALLYQATPEAIAIETFLDEQNRASTGRGSLRQGDIAHLRASLQQLDEALQLSPAAQTSTRSRAIAEEWQRAFEVWNTMAREAAQYLANMTNAIQEGQLDLEAYQVYKAAVVAYVHGFAQALTQYSRRIRELLAMWSATEKKEQLIEIVSQYLQPPSLIVENQRTSAEVVQEARNQVEALANWFAEGRNADSFRRNALMEVDKVVRRAAALAATARPSTNYVAHLNTLAHQLLVARDGETAQQLFSAAFTHLLPVHLPESLAGSASDVEDTNMRGAWQEPPSIGLYLRPISRVSRGEPYQEDVMIDSRIAIRKLVAQHEAKLKKERQRFAQLFSEPYLDIGTIEEILPEDRALLLDIIDACLGDTYQQYRASDSSIVVLLNPDENIYTLLHAADGLLLLPRYRLQHQEKANDTEN
ncbi:MAG: DUF2397 domain-containing protein [Chloroflexota bacterium]|nr:DUF2397 domain-containing protein [Chloroflexota bacterium]